MKEEIGIIDYGMGNLRSVEKGLEKVGCRAEITGSADDLGSFRAIILPGVGAFMDAMEHLKSRGMDRAIIEFAGSGRLVLGICLGMQMFFDYSEEKGRHDGLGMIRGHVEKLPGGVKVPHMGWNSVKQVQDTGLFDGVKNEENFYFVHSYHCIPEDPGNKAGLTIHGVEFTSAVKQANILGFQFHPEKSSKYGLKLLKNFSDLALEVSR